VASPAQLRAYQRYGFPSTKKVEEPVPVMVVVEPEAETTNPVMELAKALYELARRENPAPVVNVEVRVPEQQPPVVNVTNEIPEAPTPVVRVQVPQQAAPQVTVQAPNVNVNNEVPSLQDIRIVSMPSFEAEVERDPGGRIKRIKES
jgi:hypothetical protein